MAKCGRATRKPGNPPCARELAPGAVACRNHGGASPQAQRKAAERVVEERAATVFASLADRTVPVEDPFAALSQVAGEVLAFKTICGEQLAELREVRSTDAKGVEQVNALVAVFERAMDRAVSTLAAIAKLDIEDRLARVTVAQRQVIVRACLASFGEFGEVGRDPVRVQAAEKVLARELTAGTRS